jgi:hypothetical protein
VSELGGVSVVVADFCKRGLFADDTAAYRLAVKRWDPVSSIRTLFEVNEWP